MTDDVNTDDKPVETAAAFAAGAAVRSTVTRDVAIAENDEGTIVEVLEGQTIYAVEFAGGTYNYLVEAELTAANGAEPTATQSRVRNAVAASRVTAERTRVAALAGLSGKVPAATITAAIADPTQTAATVALAHLMAAKSGPSALEALAADAQGTPRTPHDGGADDVSPAKAAAARAARINKRFAVGGRETSRSGR